MPLFTRSNTPTAILEPGFGALAYGRCASQVLDFRQGYGLGYIIGAITRRLGSVQALAPE